MNILIDTNVFIPLETNRLQDVEPNTCKVNQLYRICKQLEYHIFLLDIQKEEILNDKNEERKRLRLLASDKYEIIHDVNITDIIREKFPSVKKFSHDYYDIALLNALCSNAVSILVTDDLGIHAKAKEIGKQEYVYLVSDALQFFLGQLPVELVIKDAHPVVSKEKCYNLDLKDVFFDSLRKDYPEFDRWFKNKCQEGLRDALVIRENNKLIGVCIYKFEKPCYEMDGAILKICTFKLSVSGNKLGELLLKKLFDYSYDSNVDWIYVTAFEKNFICSFFETFGFEKYHERKDDTGELIFRRKMKPDDLDYSRLNALDFAIKFGPRYYKKDSDAFIVPVITKYHGLLFPDLLESPSLFPEMDYGLSASNAITKAYICNSNTSLVQPGSFLFFYESHHTFKLRACGVVESIERLNSVDKILAFAGKRTVYARIDIENMLKDSLLVILFRQVDSLASSVDIKSMKERKLIKGIPQSITKISEEAKKWLLEQTV